MTAEQLKQSKVLAKQFFGCKVPGSFYAVETVNDLEFYYAVEELQKKESTTRS